MNLFETLLHPDQEELELKERTVVISAANILQVGEFQLLQLAYRDWHGRDMSDAGVSELFSHYMLYNEVPHWARHYARTILAKAERGEINDADPSFHEYDADFYAPLPRGLRRFTVAVLVLVLTLGGGILIASMSETDATSILPPYFDKKELRANPMGG
jgi:hypothetical protein